MKKYSIIIVLFVFAASFWNCEKDDICEDGTITTPQLVVEFYDATDNTLVKQVPSIAYFENSVSDTIKKTAVSKIYIPLKTNEDTVTFKMILNGADNDNSDDVEDSVTINYSRKDIYISRACDYKTNFTISDFIVNSTNWIANSTIEQTNVTNENEIHVKIYF